MNTKPEPFVKQREHCSVAKLIRFLPSEWEHLERWARKHNSSDAGAVRHAVTKLKL